MVAISCWSPLGINSGARLMVRTRLCATTVAGTLPVFVLVFWYLNISASRLKCWRLGNAFTVWVDATSNHRWITCASLGRTCWRTLVGAGCIDESVGQVSWSGVIDQVMPTRPSITVL
jgi:hypothetical protein